MKSKAGLTKYQAPEFGRRQRKWTEGEHERMFDFLRKHRREIIKQLESCIKGVKTNKRQFFTAMAAFLESKDEKQCKSRYQKKEPELLKALKVPHNLLEACDKHEKPITKPVKDKKPVQKEAPLASSRLEKTKGEISSLSIRTFQDLKSSLNNWFIPRIRNESIRTQMERFLVALPTESDPKIDLPSFNLNSISIIQQQLNDSIYSIKNHLSELLDDAG